MTQGITPTPDRQSALIGDEPSVRADSQRCVIRMAHEGDVDAVFAVRLAVRENQLTMSELAELGVTPDAFRQELRTAPATWVAETAGRIVGFATPDFDTGSVFALFVDPASEGTGVGGKLLAAVETALFARFPVIWLETDRHSRAAAFYERRGWRVVAELPEGDVRMEKRNPHLGLDNGS